MLKKKLLMVMLVGCLVAVAQPAWAGIVLIEHVGDTDPGTEGWGFWGGSGIASSLGGEAGRQGGAGSANPMNMNVQGLFAANPGLLADGFTFDLRAAVISGTDLTFNVRDPFDNANSMLTSTVWVGMLPTGNPDSSTNTPINANQWYDFQIAYDPAGDGGNGLYSFNLDGSLAWTRTRAQMENSGGADWFGWYSGGEWIVSLARVTMIPEPATMLVLAIGGGLALLSRRRR